MFFFCLFVLLLDQACFFLIFHFFDHYRLPLVATSVCSPAWSHLRSQVLRAAMWASTRRALVAIMQTPTLSVSVFSKCNWMLLAVWVAIQQPGHNGISSGLFQWTSAWWSLDLSPVYSCEWPLEGAGECSLLLSGQLCHSMGILGGCFFFFSCLCVCVYIYMILVCC